MALFESYERREKQILAKLAEYGINSIEEAAEVTKAAGLDVYKMIEGIQPICFENAKWAYTVGAAIAIKKGCRKASEAAAAIGEGLQSFCIPGSVADQRKVGLGHGNLGKMLLEEDTECFAFLAGHESFAAAEGAIGIAEKANKVRQKPLRVILNGLGKDAAQIFDDRKSRRHETCGFLFSFEHLLKRLFYKGFLEFTSFVSFLDANCNSYSHTNHRVVTCTDQTHHFYVSRNRRRTCELCIGMHTSQSICHTIGSSQSW